jgi:hypothetical protein
MLNDVWNQVTTEPLIEPFSSRKLGVLSNVRKKPKLMDILLVDREYPGIYSFFLKAR